MTPAGILATVGTSAGILAAVGTSATIVSVFIGVCSYCLTRRQHNNNNIAMGIIQPAPGIVNPPAPNPPSASTLLSPPSTFPSSSSLILALTCPASTLSAPTQILVSEWVHRLKEHERLLDPADLVRLSDPVDQYVSLRI